MKAKIIDNYRIMVGNIVLEAQMFQGDEEEAKTLIGIVYNLLNVQKTKKIQTSKQQEIWPEKQM